MTLTTTSSQSQTVRIPLVTASSCIYLDGGYMFGYMRLWGKQLQPARTALNVLRVVLEMYAIKGHILLDHASVQQSILNL